MTAGIGLQPRPLVQSLGEALSRNWWTVALRGALALVFGIVAFMWPGITLVSLVLLWGAYALVDGIMALIAGIRFRHRGWPFWQLIVVGLLGLGAGIATFVNPAWTALALLFLIAGWAVVTGVLEIAAAIRLRREIDHEWLLALAGVVSILFGVVMIARPGVGALAVVWAIAGYAVLFGILLIALGFRLKRLGQLATR
jgi:uncharacterized membrane protein HdeD (DUF308 family)